MTKNTKKTTKTAEPKIDTYPDLPTVSARIRAMDSDGHTRSVIAKSLGKRYQHVRNVLITPLMKDLKKEA